MDLLKEFFDDKGYMKHIKIPLGATHGVVRPDPSSDDEDVEDEVEDQAKEQQNEQKFLEDYRKAEEKLYARNIKAQEERSLYDIDTDTTLGPEEEAARKQRCAATQEVYQKYTFSHNKLPNSTLPIAGYKTQIIDFLRSNSVLIIQGPTGCGKTTQVPQYILDNCRENGEYCSIIVTQPRRIAAISVARRVCEERGWAIGSVCGYQVGLERHKTPDTILTYVTTGVLLQAIVKAKSLQNYTHIIIDEVHERSQEMDFVLLLIRKFLYTNSFNIKIILMSATFDTIKFQDYFKNTTREIYSFPPTLYLTEESKYNTQLYYIDQLETLQRVPEFNIGEPKIDPILYQTLVMLVRIFDRLDKGAGTPNQQVGSVLVFLPGIHEIEEAYRSLTSATGLKDQPIQWYILPLHSSITSDEQRKVFDLPNPGYRKIILSTNIAESSITVPDITYVIDFCLTKNMIVNPITKYESLQLQWASQVNCTQRAGRVGRVNDGRVYRFVSRTFYEDDMQQDVIPEMLRAPLDRIVLNAKELNLVDPPKAILALAIDPPNLANIQATIWTLKEAGGLALTCRGVNISSDGDLTYLGHIMANLPLNIHLSKLVFLGHMFSSMNDCIIMAAGCSLSNIFSTPFQEKMSGFMNRVTWADGTCSDLLAYLHLYKVWYRKRESNLFNPRSEKVWAQKNYINLRSLREWNVMVDELKNRLENLGLRESVGERRINISDPQNALFLKVCIAGALYPNYFRKPSTCNEGREQAAVKILSGRDPFKTVYFTDMDKSQPGPLYARRVKELFDYCKGSINVQFDSSSRVYVEFNIPTMNELVTIDGQTMVSTMPGNICKEVYLAVKRRQLRMDNVIKCLPPADSWKLANKLGITETSSTYYRQQNLSAYSESVIPTIDMQYVKISVSLFIDCGHFWAHNVDEHTNDMLRTITKKLNSHELLKVAKKNLNTNDVYACIYDDDLYYRCKIVSNSYYAHNSSNEIQVIFIDYGDIRLVSWESIRSAPAEVRDIPPQAMECILCCVRPSIILNPRAMWSDRANEAFQKQIHNMEVFAKVYSVVNNIVHLELYKNMPGDQGSQISFNEWLIRKGYAQKAEESYLSKENHEKREKYQAYENTSVTAQIEDYRILDCPDVEPPNERACSKYFCLKGPFSPLETRIFSMLNNSIEKNVIIESTSINSVLLDTDPQEKHDRLVVAVNVGENSTQKHLSLRHTTIMPNIQGFPMIMALLFSPKMEPKPIKDGTRFGAILCGLGVSEFNNKPLFPEHNLVVTLDTELSQELLSQINELRYWMNMTVRTIESVSKDLAPSVDINVCQREIKHRLETILTKPKKAVEYEDVKYGNTWRKFLYYGEIMEVGDKNLMENDIWPMHWTMCLKEVDETTMEHKKNLDELKEYATGMKPLIEVTCTLCNVTLYKRSAVGLHMISKEHTDKAKSIVI